MKGTYEGLLSFKIMALFSDKYLGKVSHSESWCNLSVKEKCIIRKFYANISLDTLE